MKTDDKSNPSEGRKQNKKQTSQSGPEKKFIYRLIAIKLIIVLVVLITVYIVLQSKH